MTRVVDRGAIVAAYVGIGMAVTIAISFLLVIPIEPIYWLLALPAGPADRLLREPAQRPAARPVVADPRQRAARRPRHRADAGASSCSR